MIILAVLLAIVATVLALAGKFVKMRVLTFTGMGIFVLAALSAFAAVYAPVAANETAVPIAFGHTGTELSAGVHLVNPFTHLVKYPTQQQDYRMAARGNEGSQAGDDSVAFIGSDNGQLTADVDVYFTVTDATRTYHALGTLERVEDVFIRGNVRSLVNQEANKYTSDELMHNINVIEPAVEAQARALFTQNGLTLEAVKIRTPVPGQNLQAKLQAQQAAEAAKARQDQAKIEAQTAVIQAAGQAKAAETLGQAIERFPSVTCNTFVQGLLDGKINGPVYVAPGCPSGSSAVTPLVQQPASK